MTLPDASPLLTGTPTPIRRPGDFFLEQHGPLWYEPTRDHPDELVIVVREVPGPQGSKSFKGMTKPKDGSRPRAIMVESSKKVKPWREAVEEAAREVLAADPTWQPGDAPIYGRMTFTVRKPLKPKASVPDRMPDLSKLLRATEDALTVAGAWADDARIVEYHGLAKRYPLEGLDALNVPGVVIRLRVTPWGLG